MNATIKKILTWLGRVAADAGKEYVETKLAGKASGTSKKKRTPT